MLKHHAALVRHKACRIGIAALGIKHIIRKNHKYFVPGKQPAKQPVKGNTSGKILLGAHNNFHGISFM